MERKTDKSVIETAYGKKLDTPIPYSFSWDECKDEAEVRAEKLYPNGETITKFVNATAKANARQKALTAALEAAGIEKPTLENDAQLRLRKMYDILVANGDSHEVARQAASAHLKIEWAD